VFGPDVTNKGLTLAIRRATSQSAHSRRRRAAPVVASFMNANLVALLVEILPQLEGPGTFATRNEPKQDPFTMPPRVGAQQPTFVIVPITECKFLVSAFKRQGGSA